MAGTDDRPDVSAIVAAYDIAPYIDQCVDSLLASKDCRVEVIVVDDASRDATRETVRAGYAGDSRVRLLSLGENRGPSHARNVGMGVARGQWLAIVDGDDWCDNLRFSKLIAAANAVGADMISDDQYLVEDGSRAPWSTINRVSRWRQDVARPVDLERFLVNRHIVKPLIARRFVENAGTKFFEEIRHGEDFLFFSELLMAGARWYMVPDAMYYYRLRSGALTNTGEFAGDNARALERLLELQRERGDAELAKLCERELRGCRRNARVRALRLALRRRDIPSASSLLRQDTILLWWLFKQEFSVAPLRARRLFHRRRFG